MQLENLVQIGKIPHLLFHGQPGVGKTSTAVALANDLFGKLWQYNLHIYNASDDRGINFIRTKIRNLVSIVPVGVPYQIIFLDEADELTREAQTALREIMQKHTDTTKFILSCNCSENIILPIRDRCIVLAFNPIAQDVIVQRLKMVCSSERIGYDDGILEIIAETSGGSLRKAIQSIELYRNKNNYISRESFQKFSAPFDDQTVKLLLDDVFAGDISGSEERLHNLYRDGYRAINIFNEIIKAIDNNPHIEKAVKQDLIDQTGLYEWRISQGSNELLQMRCYLNSLGRASQKHTG
ncbi:hypothetical protein SDC9_113798 [bioreactor metagenome]|uniref:AAA+ ATPase domain-containing protein n=1 Tax=bioreactor metagenome TaxID=1076179 RepID=A0A645BNE3_9ZZZZ